MLKYHVTFKGLPGIIIRAKSYEAAVNYATKYAAELGCKNPRAMVYSVVVI